MEEFIKKRVIAFAVMMFIVCLTNAQRQKPIWDGRGLQCMNCGSFLVKNKHEGWTGSTKDGLGKLKTLWGPCPTCGKYWRVIGESIKDYRVEPVLDSRFSKEKKKHKSGSECFLDEKIQTGNILSCRITNRCPKHETLYVILRKKNSGDDVVYIVEYGNQLIKNLDLNEYDSIVRVYHNKDISTSGMRVGN